MMWGFAGPWYGQLCDYKRSDLLMAQLESLVGFGIRMTSIGLRELVKLAPAERDRLAGFIADNDFHLNIHLGGAPLDADDATVQRVADEAAAVLERHREMLRGFITHTSAGAGHRFDRTAAVEEKLARVSRVLAPLARACREVGLPLGIENHGDYYCSDLVGLCRMTPDLWIFLDTGNTYLIGERPLPAYEAAAPYVIGGHFKDHRVRPKHDTLHFELDGCVLGEGDADLRQCWEILLARAPSPRALVMEMEVICPKEMHPSDCLRRSLAFCQSLPCPE